MYCVSTASYVLVCPFLHTHFAVSVANFKLRFAIILNVLWILI
jgi:hypothetical protein